MAGAGDGVGGAGDRCAPVQIPYQSLLLLPDNALQLLHANHCAIVAIQIQIAAISPVHSTARVPIQITAEFPIEPHLLAAIIPYVRPVHRAFDIITVLRESLAGPELTVWPGVYACI